VPGSPQSEPDSQAQAEAIVKRHIKLLHAYNEIKDVGLGLMGLIADSRGVRLKEVMEEMGVGEKD
jgi:DNA repair protein Swi5/Sae3